MTDAAASSRGWTATMLAVLGRLAAAPDKQLRYLSELGLEGSTDELALEFDDVFRPLGQKLSGGGFVEVLEALNEIDMALSSEGLEWTERALALSPDWARIRLVASRAARLLAAMEE